jgi:hypothetical protein
VTLVVERGLLLEKGAYIQQAIQNFREDNSFWNDSY